MNDSCTELTGATPPFANDPDRACGDLDFAEFYPDDTEDARAVKRVCHRCPLVEACREWAIAHDEFGVWGATTETDRHRIRRQRGIATPASRQPRFAASPLIERRLAMDALLGVKTAAEIAGQLGIAKRTVQRYQQARAA